MRICAVMKYPPIQGGVSARCYWLARLLAERGHKVTVVTNAGEVEDDYRIWVPPEDVDRLEATFPNGGSVSVVGSGRFEETTFHIPYANPYVTKLAALATEEIRARGADLVFSVYFEPYALSGSLAAAWTGLPHVVQHAGSDRTRLMDHPELAVAYREMLRGAAAIVTGDLDLQGLGISEERFARLRHGFLPEVFTPDGPVCDVDRLVKRLAGSPYVTNTGPLDPDTATVGIYGKLGEAKGSYDLLAALARLRGRGHRFNLLVLGGGRERGRFLAAACDLGLEPVTWTLPFLPQWRVPEVLRACTAVCFLERQFPVEIHSPGIPQEILATGRCAVLSEEVARKQTFWPLLRSGEYALVVPDPRDVTALAATLEPVVADPQGAVALGKAGASLVRPVQAADLGATYEALFAGVLARSPAGAGVRSAVGSDDLRALLTRHMPAAARVLGEAALGRCVDEAVGEGERLPFAEQALVCADLVAERLAGQVPDGTDSELLREVAEFERNRLWLAVDVESVRGLPMFPRLSPAVATRQERRARLETVRPVRSNWLRLRQFSLDVEAAERALAGSSAPAKPSREPQLLAFQKRGSLKGRIFRVGPAMRELVDLCDGERTLAEIAEVASRRHGAPVQRVREELRRLAHERVVALI